MLSSSICRASTRFPSSRRYLSAPNTYPISPNHSIYLSRSTDPHFNLTFEDWLFRHSPAEKPLLLIYRDERCVVIGRNQNPWKEVNFPALRKAGIPFIRRRSGGGTVYHDLGNTNFSIHLPRTSFDRHATAQIVLRAVRSLGIDAHINDRNDLCVGEDKMSSAYKIVNKRAYHHGTMLISTCLDTLGDLLHSNKENMITRGVASVRSPVCNLQQFRSDISHDMFSDAVVQAFREEYNIDQEPYTAEEDGVSSIDYIRKGMNELPSWDWAYGQTPEFTYSIKKTFEWGSLNAEIKSKHGVILLCSLSHEGADESSVDGELSDLTKALEGKSYGFVDDTAVEEKIVGIHSRDVWKWLKTAMER